MIETKPCPDCNAVAVLIVSVHIMLTSNPPQWPSTWACLCGYRKSGPTFKKRGLAEEWRDIWRASQPSPELRKEPSKRTSDGKPDDTE